MWEETRGLVLRDVLYERERKRCVQSVDGRRGEQIEWRKGGRLFDTGRKLGRGSIGR